MAITDPITAALDAIGAHVATTLGERWKHGLMPFPVSDKTFKLLVRSTPFVAVMWRQHGENAGTACLDGRLEVTVVLVVNAAARDLAIAANAVAVRAAAALHRWEPMVVYAEGDEPQRGGTVNVTRLAPVMIDGLALENLALVGIELTLTLSLVDFVGVAVGLPDFAGIDIIWSTPGLAEAAADTLSTPEPEAP